MSETKTLKQRINHSLDLITTPVSNPWVYGLIYRYIAPRDITTMNWGFAPANPALEQHHPVTGEALQLQLYWETFDLCAEQLEPDQSVCEVSCGRGGGLAFVRNLTNAQVIGLERDAAARNYARNTFGLDVRKTVGPDINMRDESVDVFLSVEAAHNYRCDRFFSELHRCLKPGGQVLMSDFKIGDKDKVYSYMSNLLQNNGLRLESWGNISSNVMQSLKIDHERQERMVRRLPKFLQSRARDDNAAVGSNVYNGFVSGERTYFSLRARKPA